ncbi:peptidyl-tRNA hydrolase, PTH1 family [Thermodesulfobium acidiphilum]|uniref:Peptidyl-tRNA hydrolase n=1 Tax=Thermodesulfobium acidiphilum TaxID=1794699 RepID=A0A2R4VYW3_THEAF|nr:aminoacyl-tRNA hydrolase [Thermodesulfobium acidiphilum]AWB09654.1 peptidyl-tRNA hydrolase, PTH1 family [Thermodesulfobium acidiphilum]
MNLTRLSSKQELYLIVGLGNIGKEYTLTRHNVGFLFLDFLFENLGFNFSKFEEKINNLIFLKPDTYMNRSGIAVRKVSDFYKIDHKNIIVIYDDLDLEFKTIRFRSKGSSAGHKGMQSIIEELGTQLIPRIKIGIGRKEGVKARDWVLSNFDNTELSCLPKIFESVATCLEIFLEKGENEALMKCGKVKVSP